MDNYWVAALAFGAGWILREWSYPVRTDETPVCHCQCSVPAPVVTEHPYSGPPAWVLVLVAFLVIVIFGNTALALRFSYQDTATGQDKTVSVAVKGKSKGVYGGVKGLTITN